MESLVLLDSKVLLEKMDEMETRVARVTEVLLVSKVFLDQLVPLVTRAQEEMMVMMESREKWVLVVPPVLMDPVVPPVL